MSVALTFPRPTERARLEEAASRVRERAGEWVRLPLREKIALARSLQAGVARVAERSVAAACAAKGIPAGSPLEGEEWLGGPYVALRLLAQLLRSLESLERTGAIPVPRPGRTAEGRLSLRVFPGDRLVLVGSAEALAGAREALQAPSSDKAEAPSFRIGEVAVGEGSTWAGRSLADLDLRGLYRVNVIGIQRGEERFTAPEPGEVLRAGDRLVVAGTAPDVEGLCGTGDACERLGGVR